MIPVFFSIVHEDKLKVIHVLKHWQRRNLIPGVKLILEEEDVRQQSKPGIKQYLKKLIDQAEVVVFVIGNDTHSKPWIEWEYQYAQNKKRHLVYMHLRRHKGFTVSYFPAKETARFKLKRFKTLVLERCPCSALRFKNHTCYSSQG